MEWTETQRDAAKAFIAEAMPIPRYLQSPCIEVEMPQSWRRGFDRMFTVLGPIVAPAKTPA